MTTRDHCKFQCGDRVFDKIDPRHVGTIRSIDKAFAYVEWKPNLESALPIRTLALEQSMLNPKINWDDAEARFRLIEEIGPAAYKIAFEAFREQTVFAMVNGHALRRVQSQFGMVIAIDGTDRAFRTRVEAEGYARSLPTARRESYRRVDQAMPSRPAPARQQVMPHGAPRRIP